MSKEPLTEPEQYTHWQRGIYEVIFEADTRSGKLFDVILFVLIVTSVLAICFESIYRDTVEIDIRSAQIIRVLFAIEWAITIFFTIEYWLRVVCVKYPFRYIFSFYGIVDLLAILPSYVALTLGAGSSLGVLRAIRLLRVFRVLKLVWLLSEAHELGSAIWQARAKIVVFISVVLVAVTIAGSIMYELEPDNFRSIPHSIYWAIVTMSTVGYGDLVPQTPAGKLLSAVLILLGYSLIIVPTGFVSAEFLRSSMQRQRLTTQVCSVCMREGHDSDAVFCKYCGGSIN